MRIIYMGTPDFAVPALKMLHEKGEHIVAIYTQPPRRSGRGKKLKKSPTQLYGEAHNITVRHPHKLRDNQEEIDFIKNLSPDVIVVAAYGLILPQEILDIPPYGALNIHGSLLPRWRGASPIQSAILAGDKKSGVSIMRMTAQLDAGAVYKEHVVPITQKTTASTLHDQLAQDGAKLLYEVLKTWPAPIEQSDSEITYARQLSREDGIIDWTREATSIDRQIRALTPWPGTFTHTPQDVRLKIGEAEIVETQGQFGTPGTIIDEELTVACGQGLLKLKKLQRPSKTMMSVEDFLKGFDLPANTLLQ